MFATPAAAASLTSPTDAELARYLVHENSYGVVATRSIHLDGQVFSNVMSVSDGIGNNSTGRIFFYMTVMDATGADLAKDSAASITFSQAQIVGDQSCGAKDPEDPTCARLTISGDIVALANGDNKDFALKALFSRNPAMAHWPLGHGWDVLEMKPQKLILLSHYGGAAHIPVSDYFAAAPARGLGTRTFKPDASCAAGSSLISRVGTSTSNLKAVASPTPATKPQEARKLVHDAIWGVLSSTSVGDKKPNSYVESVSDGAPGLSTGRLWFYLTDKDDIVQDVAANNNVSFTISEAMLDSEVTSGAVCHGVIAEDPTCGRITLSGQLHLLSDPADIKTAKAALFARHPVMAKWPATHGFMAYELAISEIFFLNFYGGARPMSVSEYYAATPASAHAGQLAPAYHQQILELDASKARRMALDVLGSDAGGCVTGDCNSGTCNTTTAACECPENTTGTLCEASLTHAEDDKTYIATLSARSWTCWDFPVSDSAAGLRADVNETAGAGNAILMIRRGAMPQRVNGRELVDGMDYQSFGILDRMSITILSEEITTHPWGGTWFACVFNHAAAVATVSVRVSTFLCPTNDAGVECSGRGKCVPSLSAHRKADVCECPIDTAGDACQSDVVILGTTASTFQTGRLRAGEWRFYAIDLNPTSRELRAHALMLNSTGADDVKVDIFIRRGSLPTEIEADAESASGGGPAFVCLTTTDESTNKVGCSPGLTSGEGSWNIGVRVSAGDPAKARWAPAAHYQLSITQWSCPRGCSSHGACRTDGTCACDSGWQTALDCSADDTPLPANGVEAPITLIEPSQWAYVRVATEGSEGGGVKLTLTASELDEDVCVEGLVGIGRSAVAPVKFSELHRMAVLRSDSCLNKQRAFGAGNSAQLVLSATELAAGDGVVAIFNGGAAARFHLVVDKVLAPPPNGAPGGRKRSGISPGCFVGVTITALLVGQ